MMVVANLGTPHAAEKFLCQIRASAVEAVRLFVMPLGLGAAGALLVWLGVAIEE
jgi:hypothetical protein